MATRTIKVDYIARVEGESSLDLHIRNGTVEAASLSIFEPPRFFEALLRGRGFGEVLDIVARICGICPVAYQMSAVHAIEGVLGIEVGEPICAPCGGCFIAASGSRATRCTLSCCTHPIFSATPMRSRWRVITGEAVERGLALKKTGNELLRLLGGREIHPVNVRVGGFYRTPTRAELMPLAESLKQARDLAIETLRWACGLSVSRCRPRLRVRRTAASRRSIR